MKIRNIFLILGILLLSLAIIYLWYGYYNNFTQEVKNPIATIEVEGYGTIKVELYPDIAPNTVKNFITLANNGFYDGLTFHRTVPEFIIQGGKSENGNPMLSDLDETILEEQDEAYNIEGEFISNGYTNNTLRHDRGVISMARLSYYSSISSNLITKDYNSAGSEFFIMTESSASLNRTYAAFGRVIEGMDIADLISNVEVITRDTDATEGVDEPVIKPVITSIRVDTFGVDYGLPQILEVFDYNQWLMDTYGLDSSLFEQ